MIRIFFLLLSSESSERFSDSPKMTEPVNAQRFMCWSDSLRPFWVENHRETDLDACYEEFFQ